MNRMTTHNSQLTTSKTALVSSSHEQFIPERMKKVNLFAKTLGVLVLMLVSSFGVFGQADIDVNYPYYAQTFTSTNLNTPLDVSQYTNSKRLDVNNDGILDLVHWSMSTTGILIFQADGSFQNVTVPSGSTSRGRVFEDINGDGLKDFVTFSVTDVQASLCTGIVSGIPQFAAYSNVGNITGAYGSFGIYGASSGDLDNDGDIDLVIAGPNGPYRARMLINDGTGNFSMFNLGTTPYYQSQCVVVDFDIDGDLDVLIPNTNSDIILYKNNGVVSGLPTFSESVIVNDITFDSNSTWLEVVDLNNDGKNDMIWNGYPYQSPGVWAQQTRFYVNTSASNAGPFTFARTETPLAPGAHPNYQSIGGYNSFYQDIDGNGVKDIYGCLNGSTAGHMFTGWLKLTIDPSTNQVSFTKHPIVHLGPLTATQPNGRYILRQDINSDNKLDYLVTYPASTNERLIYYKSAFPTINLSSLTTTNLSNRIFVSGAYDATLTVTIASNLSGTITVNGGSGGTVTGSGTGSVTITGTTQQINNSLGGMTYLPGVGGTHTLAITVTNANSQSFTSNQVIIVSNPISASATPTSLSNFSTCAGTASATQTTSVSGNGLTAPLVVTAPSGYEVSTSATTGFGASVSLTPTSGTVAATTIYVRLAAATAAGTYNANLTVTSTGATTTNVALTGVVNANPVLAISNPAAVCNPATVNLTAAAVTAGSTGTFTLSYWTNSAATASLSTPSAVASSGTYYIKATTSAGCVDIEPVTVTVASALSAVTLSANAQPCGNTATGTATVTTTGGAPTFTYTWTRNGSAYVATPANAPTNLLPGTYIVTVTDACGTTIQSNSVSLNSTIAIDLQAASLGANALCFGGNGSISASIFGGTSQRSLVVTNTSTNISYTQVTPSGPAVSGVWPFTINVPAGTYSVSAVDAGSTCPSETWLTNVTVGQPASALAATTNKTDVCFGGTNGTITVTATGGTGTKTYSNDGGVTFQASNVFTGLAAGTYSIVVKDANNCTTTPASVTINQSGSALAVAVTSVTNANCNGASTGGVNITASGGYNTAYTYAWTGPSSFTATTEDLSNRPAGVYNVTVTDAGGCTQTATATIQQPTALAASAVATNVLCFGGSTGSVNLTVSGGTAPYTYAWSGPSSYTATTEDLTARPIGTYNVVVTDANNCTINASASITQPAVLASTNVVTNVLCNGTSTGAINLTATGGTTPYTFAWTGPASFTATTEDLSNRPAGAYSVTVTDANGCTATTSNIQITQPTALTLTAVNTPVSCNGGTNGTITATAGGGTTGYTYSINGTTFQATATFSGLSAGTYTVTVKDANNCTTTATTTITQPTAISASTAVTNVLCNGASTGAVNLTVTGGTTPYTFAWTGTSFTATTEDLTSRPAGTYNVVITDVNSCTANASATITQPTALTATAVRTNVSCFGGTNGTITATAAGGTAPYTYSINGTTFQTSATFSGLAAGNYTVTVKDANNCTATATVLTITQPSALAITDDGGSPASCSNTTDGAYFISVSGGTSPYTYAWTGPNSFTSTTQDQVYNLAPGTYAVTVTDANACTATLTNLVITSPPAINISTAATNVTCFQGTNGAINATITGGSPAFTYQWKKNGVNFATTEDLTGIGAGTYVLTVTDGNFCQNSTASIVITQGPQITATVAANAAAICGGSNAVFTITGTAGNVVTYNLNGGSNTTATIAAGGTATVTVTAASSSQTLNLVSVSNGSCSNALTGSALVTVTPVTNAITISNSLCTVNSLQWMTMNSITATTAAGIGQNGVSVAVTQSGGGMAINNGMFQPQDFPAQYNVPGLGAPTIQNNNAGNFQACFSQPVTNPVVAFSSIGAPNIPVTVTVSQPYTQVWSGGGMTWVSNTQFIGAEGDNIIRIDGTVTCVNFNYNTSENYATIAFGFENQNCYTPTICPGQSVTLTAAGSNNYVWSPSTGLNTTSGATVIATPTATTTYTVSNSTNICETPKSITVVVSPLPTITSTYANQTVCNGAQVPVNNLTSNVNGTTFAWTRTAGNIGIATSGTGSVPAFTATNSGVAPITSTFTVTPTSLSSCVGSPQTYTVTVNPTPTVNNFTAQTVCAGSTNAAVVPTGAVTGTNYAWTNSNTAIGLAASGNGTIPSFTAVNAGATAQTATISVTPSYGGNMGTTYGATSENGSIVLTAPAGTYFTGVQFASYGTPTGSLGNYSIGSCHAANSASIVSALAVGQTTVTIPADNATFGDPCGGVGKSLAVVLTYGTFGSSCSGTAKTYTITVNPTPVVSNKTVTACSGSAFTTTTGGSDVVPAGTQYTWTVAANANVTGASNQTTATATISQTLTNTTNTAQTVVYTVTPISGTCSGATFTVTVTVNPTPTVTAQTATICSGNAFSVAPTNGSGNIVPTGTTYSWSAPAAITGISGLASGTAQTTIGGTLTNATAAPINVTYVVTPTSGSCAGASFNVVVTVNPRPAITNMTATICSGSAFTSAPVNVTNGVVPTGTTYTWTVAPNANVTGETSVATASNNISQTLNNTTVNAEIVTYTVTPTANTCAGSTFTVAVTVNPIPVIANKTSTICSGTAFTVAPTTAGSDLVPTGTTYTWTVAANANVTGETNQAVAQSSISQNLVNTTSAIETVVYTVTPTFGGCTGATFTVTVTVNPTPQIAAKTNNACSGVAVTLSPVNGSGDVVPTGTTYTWTVVDNPNVIGETNANTAQTSIAQTLVNNYTSAQQVVYTVTPTANGCAGTPFTYTVTVSTPVAVAALTGATNVCLGATTQLASATAGGVWSSSNTAVATISATGVVTGLTTGTTTVSYTVTNSVGCTGVVTANVNVNALPVATITPSGSTTICQGASVTLTASAGSTYLWSNGLQSSSITVTTAGNYSVQVTNAAGCVTTSAVTAVVVNPLPTATITANGPTTFCQGGTVTLTASAGSSYLWSNGATTSSITVNASGCYSVTVTNANGCSATSACTQVTVNALPVATISSLNGTSFCQGGSVTLVSTPGSTYAWSNNLTTQSINVTASANLTVTVTNAAGCSSTSAPFAVTMNPLPTATITAGGPLTFCQGGSVVLTAGGGTSYTWTNTTSTASSITVNTSGVYTVTATNANGCTATSAPVTVTVNALPVVAAIAGSNDVCVGSTTILTNATTGGVWSSSNTSAATVSASGVVTGVAAGAATINYTVTNASGCVTTSSLVINVNALPVNIPIGGPSTVCVGSTITNFATPGGVWSSSNVSIATVAQNGVITGVAAGTATISYTITTAAGCSATVTKVVTVNALPTVAVAANGPLTFCQGGSVTLTASGGTSYAWSNSTITTPARTINASGSYTVTATNANGCFATSAPVVVNVLALPNAAIASTGSTICLGSTTTLTASGGVSYAWSNGAQTASTTVNNSNTYTVTVTGANGCTATASNVVTVNANPAVVVTANAPLTFCQGGSVTLSATGAASYVWSNGTLGSTNVITQSGTYYAQGTNAAGCTSNSAVITVTVLPTPVVAALTGSNTVCEASTITLSSATPGGVWSTSNSFIATVNNAGVITGMNAGSAVITYTLSNGACNASVSASVTVLNSPATPVITAGGPTTVCPNETVQLFSSNAPNYQWNSGPQTNNILVTQSGSYTVTVVGSNGCAVTSLPMTVTIGDDVDPIIVAPINVNVNPNLGCTAVGVALGTPIVSDNCTVASVTNNAPSLFPIGTTTVTWTVTDASGNTATATQLVNVVDQVAPEATAPAHVTVNTNNFCEATGVNLGTPEATDNCTIASIANDAPASFPIGTTVVTWTITDATGNFTTVTQNVTVVDTEAPVVVLQSAAVQLDANGVGVLSFEAIDNGSSDNCGIAAVSIDQTTFDCSQVGFNTVTVTITDNSGNQSEGTVVINVIASDACGSADVAGPNVPDAFTPNGNSINDTWVIPGLEGYNTKQMAVYSRYGTLVYYSSAYANDWDGTLMGNGVAVPDGTYYYTLTLDGGKQLSGYVYINRVKQ